jgi:hypothetical protein
MAGMLARWNFSPRLFKPLQHCGESYRELATMTEPLRSKVERLRVAELLGWLAVGQFKPWDEVDFPLPETMYRLRADDLNHILDQARTDLAQVCESSLGGAGVRTSAPAEPQCDAREVRYFKLGVEPHDLLANLLESLKMTMVRVPREVACQPQPVLVNCLDVSRERLEWFLDDAIPDTSRPLVCNAALPRHSEAWGTVVQTPCSFGSLAHAISTAVQDAQQ